MLGGEGLGRGTSLATRLGAQSLECRDWHPPLNRDRFAQGLDALNLV